MPQNRIGVTGDGDKSRIVEWNEGLNFPARAGLVQVVECESRVLRSPSAFLIPRLAGVVTVGRQPWAAVIEVELAKALMLVNRRGRELEQRVLRQMGPIGPQDRQPGIREKR